jgi:hypothetical protein
MYSLRRFLFGIRPRDWSFARRGFYIGEPAKVRHLERIIGSFVDGFHTTLDDSNPETLATRLDAVEPEFRGFGYEGVGLCLGLFDLLTPWERDRWRTFQQGRGSHQSFLLHVGYGLLLARLGRPAAGALKRLAHPGERWLAIDGYGFHEGFFHWHQYIEERAAPRRLDGYAARVFDQGLGRVLWFGSCADVDRVTRTVATFPVERRADLWSGIGVACTYAGGVGADALKRLYELAGPYQAQVRLGCVLATKLRHQAGIVVAHTERALDVLCGLSADGAARLFDAAVEDLPPDGVEPAYEVLRRRIQHQVVSTQELTT